MTKDYSIAGSILRIEGSGADLRRLAGFAPFRLNDDPDRIPFLTINTEADIADWSAVPDIMVLDKFPLEDIGCEFARHAEGYVFRMAMPDGRIFLLWHTTGSSIMLSNIGADGEPDPTAMRFMLWLAYGLALLPVGGGAIHSSVIVHKGHAVMFLGESGTGKSTHTALWREYISGAALLNDDSPILRVAEGVTPTAYGSPWSGKTPAYHNRFYPVAAIVRLSQAPHNKITRLNRLKAFGALLPSFPPSFAKDEALLDGVCKIISAVIEKVPVFHLECLPDKDAAKLVFDIVFENGEKTAE